MIPLKESRIDIINYIISLISEYRFRGENINLYVSKDENVPWVHFYFLGDSFVSVLEFLIMHSEENAMPMYGKLDITELLESSLVKKNIELFDSNIHIKNGFISIKNVTKKLGSINIDCDLIPMNKEELEAVIYGHPHFLAIKDEENQEVLFSETTININRLTDIFLIKILIDYSKKEKDLRYLYIVPSEKDKFSVLLSSLDFHKNAKEDDFYQLDLVKDILQKNKNVVSFSEFFNFVRNISLDNGKKISIEQTLLDHNEKSCNIGNRLIIYGKDYLIIKTYKAEYNRILYKSKKTKSDIDKSDKVSQEVMTEESKEVVSES